MIHQLRIYEIFEDRKAAFHARFRDHASRIMRKYGFELMAVWETAYNGRLEFAYILAWPDEESMRTAWDRFLADEERLEIWRVTEEHGPLVGMIEDRVLIPSHHHAGLAGQEFA